MDNKNYRNNKSRNRRPSNKGRITLIILLALILILVVFYFLVANYYKSHFYNNTNINGVDASNKTVSHVKDEINNELQSYSLLLEGRGDITDVINGYSIELNTIFDDSLENLLESQKGYDWPKYFFKESLVNIETMIGLDEDLFNLVFDNLAFFDEENLVEPENAYVSDYDGESYKIIEEVYGNKVKKDILYDKTLEAINVLEPKLLLEDIDSYERPTIFSDNPDLVKLANGLNDLTKAKITYEFGETIEVVDGNRISEWLIIDEDNNVSLNEEKVKEFVDYIGSNYNTFGKTRTLETSYGQTIQVSGGDYGWWLNRGRETQELIDLIKAGAMLTKEPSYLQTAAQYGDDDVGDTYVEVNITAQHLFFYKNGELIVESDFVSGNISRGHVNPTGTFPVQYKEREAILTGEDYASPVDYWMPFYGDIGFHDASWRNEFGGAIYKTNGSRGCINMPHSAAEKMFQHIERGVAVFVYEMPGTESNKTSKNY